MRRAGVVVAETLELLRDAVRPGITTADLDALAERHIRSRGATSNFLDYHGFPATICAPSTTRSSMASRATGCSRGRHRLARLRGDRRRLAR